jgi:hypothetical protein
MRPWFAIKKALIRMRGAPDFRYLTPYTLLTNEMELTLSLCLTNFHYQVDMSENDEPENIQACHFNQTPLLTQLNLADRDAIDAQMEWTERGRYQALDIVTELWYYYRGWNVPFGDSEMAVQSASLAVQPWTYDPAQGPDRYTALLNYMRDASELFYNGPEGVNTKLHQKKVESFTGRSMPVEFYQHQIDAYMESWAQPAATDYQLITNRAGTRLLHFTEPDAINRPLQHFYCLPINDHYYARLRFRYRINTAHNPDYWFDEAIRAEQKMVDTLTVRHFE